LPENRQLVRETRMRLTRPRLHARCRLQKEEAPAKVVRDRPFARHLGGVEPSVPVAMRTMLPMPSRRRFAHNTIQPSRSDGRVSAHSWVTGVLLAASIACSSAPGGNGGGAQERPDQAVIRITGSDTMVNLVQAWAEDYRQVRSAVSIQVSGGGSGVGVAGLVDGTLDLAAASREMKDDERQRTKARHGVEPKEFTVALDALAVYVHKDNPLSELSIEELAEIYGEHGGIVKWAQLGVSNPACASDQIIRVGRQNSSGTYAHFRDVVLGGSREYKMGSIDQSGSKDVVALLSRTPCAIGYSGIAFATPAVKVLKLSIRRGHTSVAPGPVTVVAGSYPLARPLYLYSAREPTGQVKAFVDWVLGREGQQTVRDLGFVPVPRA
jgi:phosphate transport system substrate-binding protein